MKYAKPTLVLFLLALAAFAVFVTTVLMPREELLAIKTYPLDLYVSAEVQLNLDTDAIHLGGAPPGGSLQRSLNISFDQDANVDIVVEGNATPLVSVSDNQFLLPAKTKKEITFRATIPEGTPYGTYTGIVTFFFFKP